MNRSTLSTLGVTQECEPRAITYQAVHENVWIVEPGRIRVASHTPAIAVLGRLLALTVLAVCCNVAVGQTPQSNLKTPQSNSEAVMPEKHAALFRAHCYDCHDSSSEEADVNLESISFNISENVENAALWQKILNAINSGEMPPEDAEPLPDQMKLEFLESLTAQMVEARKILGDTGGVVPLRRLNQREYTNTIYWLLGVMPDASSLPNDQTGSGFDTQGASLFVSSDQIEQYLESARRSLRLCFETPVEHDVNTRRVEPEIEYNERIQDYLNELKKKSEVAREFQSQSEKPASAFGLLDSHQAENQIKHFKEWSPQLIQYLDRPETKDGLSLIVTIKSVGMVRVRLPKIAANQPGQYTIRVKAAMYPEAAERFHYLEFSSFKNRQRNHLGWRKVTASLDTPQIIEFPIVHYPGEDLQLDVHQRTHQDRGEKNLQTQAQRENGIGLPPGIWIDWAESTGPTPATELVKARDEVLPPNAADISERDYVTLVLKKFAVRAFRGRQPTDPYLNRLLEHYQRQRQEGASIETSLIEPMAIILASPEFLYMVNKGRSDDAGRLTSRELAVRLSYLLWSAPPDDELMQVAVDGELDDPVVLRKQVERLLADSRASRFVEDFTHQWLQMDRLGMFQFNAMDFPTFDNAVRENARFEIFNTVEMLMRKQLPLGTLLNSDFVVINDLLAGYYGLPDVKGHEFRPVSVPDDCVRGGLLGTAAIAAMGSDGLRSSPVERGAWVLRHLLHDPPAPAPPNVPQLSRLHGKPLNARKIQQMHQEQPQCAQCHRKIDPIGFGLENFGADGLWREIETVRVGKKRQEAKNHDFPIDARGRLPGGEEFTNFLEMRKAVAEKDTAFARGFVENLIAYGMGRPFGFNDESLAESMMQESAATHFTIETFIHSLVQSETFQSR